MRTALLTLLLVTSACRDNDPYAKAAAHAGEPTVHQRVAAAGSGPQETPFLNRMLQHQQELRSLLHEARARDLSDHTRRIVERAEGQRLEREAELMAALENYRGGASPPTRPAVGESAALPGQLQGTAYEKALLRTLLANYRAEVSDIENFLPDLGADMAGLAKQMRNQRRHDIEKLTRE